MRIHIFRVGTAAALALVALALLGLTVWSASGASIPGLQLNEIGHAGPAADPQQDRYSTARNGELQLVSNRLTTISARRVISDPGLNTPLVLSENGRKIVATGHLACTKGDDYEVQTNVTQSSTGALAKGRTQGRCSGRAEQFAAATWAYDQALFKPGPAQVCAMLIIRTADTISDVFQWCRKEDANLIVARASY